MKQKEYLNEEEIINKLQEYYNEAISKNLFEENISADIKYQNLQLKLLQTTQEFAKTFELELENTPNIKRKLIVYIKKIIRKSTRFMLKPYADQMLKYQERNGELSGEIVKFISFLIRKNSEIQIMSENNQKRIESQEIVMKNQKDQIWRHEEAIYKLTNEYNSTASLVLELSGKLNNNGQKKFTSYSQAGEDKIIEFLLSYGKDKVEEFTYLDIGCNHYMDINNTYKFYEMGMHGVLIDANPDFIALAEKNRPRDICINAGIGKCNDDSLKFYVLNVLDLSSFNLDVINAAIKETPWLKVEKEIDVPVFTIDYIIEKYFNGTPEVISLDIEGDELSVLQAMDLKSYSPKIFIIETITYKANISLNNKRNEIVEFMEECGYREYAFTGVNSIFININLYSEDKSQME